MAHWHLRRENRVVVWVPSSQTLRVSIALHLRPQGALFHAVAVAHKNAGARFLHRGGEIRLECRFEGKELTHSLRAARRPS